MLKLDCFNSVKNIPENIWEKLASRQSVCMEINHLKAVEFSGINQIKPYYFIGYKNDKPIGIAYCFVMTVDFSRISNKYSIEILNTLKTWKPDFLVLKVIEVGHLASLGATIEVDKSYFNEFINCFSEKIDEIAKTENADLCIIRDIPYSDFDDFKVLNNFGFNHTLGYPIAKIDAKWKNFEDYLLTLKSKKRYNFIRKRNKINTPEISVEIIENYAPYASRLADLWKNVALKNNGYEHEKLTPEYFISMSENMKERSHIVAIKRNNEIVAFGLNLIGDEEYFGVAEGLDYSIRDEFDLYANNFFECIENACLLGKKSINIGITAYDYKAMLGAEFEPLVYFIKSFKNPDFTDVFTEFIKTGIEQPENHHNVFRNSKSDKRVQLKEIENKIEKNSNSNDIFEKHNNYTRINFARAVDLYTFCPEFESAQEPIIKHNGKDVIMLGTNSYLGLATHHKIKNAAIEAITKYGSGCSGSPLLNGTLDIHKELAFKLSQCFQKQDALIFSTGYQTNVGVISALVSRGDVLIMDERNHASIVDGALLSKTCIARYNHNNLNSLEEILKKHSSKPKLLVTDSIFSMEGTMINLPEIVGLTKKYNTRIMLDESHAIGVTGKNGMGVADYYGLTDEVDIIMGTFSKSLASIGGFVTGDSKIMDMLRHKARSHVFSASLPPSAVAVVIEALDIIKNEPERRNKLINNAFFLSSELRKLGFKINYFGNAIISLFCGHELIAVAAFNELFKRGVFVNPVTFPAVPKNKEILRISLMATHNEEMLKNAIEKFNQIKTSTFPKS